MRRRTVLLGLAGLAAVYSGWRFHLRPQARALTFREINDPPGFRRYAAGDSSSGFDPFFGLEPSPADHLQEAVAAVRADPCRALFGDLASERDIVPVASFSDYYCPYCRVQTKELAALEQRSDSDLRVAWHELPLLGEGSEVAARAALAAKRQDAYVAFHERMMKSSFHPTPDYLLAVADAIGLDADRLLADMQSDAVAAELRNSAAVARVFGFIGTPAMVIGRTVVQGRIDEATLLRIVAMERAAGRPAGCG